MYDKYFENNMCISWDLKLRSPVLRTDVLTAVGQAVACAPAMQRARVRSPVGKTFLRDVFRGFSSPVRQISGSFRPPRSPNIIWPSLSSLIIHHSLREPVTRDVDAPYVGKL